MTRYEELCGAYFAWEPHQAEIDRIFRDLPIRMKRAIREHLNPPGAAAMMPSRMMGVPTDYADLYRRRRGQDGEKIWERCGDDDALQLGAEGVREFIVGICMEREPGSLTSSMMYFTFSVESISQESVELRIENLSSKILIDLRDPAGFAKAAETTINLLVDFLRNPSETPGDKIPIGY